MIIFYTLFILSALLSPLPTRALAADARFDDPLEEPLGLEKPNYLALDPNPNLPTYISLAPNVNDFGRFADGGSDSNWYIGFNNAWIVKLPPGPPGRFARAFIGAKIGRAKTAPRSERPWELSVTPGKIYMALSQTPAFSSEQSFFLAETSDLPLEADENIYVPGAGSSRWFWAEVPLALVSSSRPNYLIIWSPTREFQSASAAPILAGMESSSGGNGSEPLAWNNHSISGVPPRTPTGSLQTPINNIRPALAIKLLPPSKGKVAVLAFEAKPLGDSLIVRFSVEGRDISAAWVEVSSDELDWRRISPYSYAPPYLVTLPHNLIPSRGAYLRAAARDALHNEGRSESVFVSHGTR